MVKDYGYFGKGINGYVHYIQTYDENSGDKKGRAKPPASGKWAAILIAVYIALYVLSFFFA